VALNAHGDTSKGESVCRFPVVSFTGHHEESVSHAKAYEGRSRQKAFWVVRMGAPHRAFARRL
jgi:hypothetical protein